MIRIAKMSPLASITGLVLALGVIGIFAGIGMLATSQLGTMVFGWMGVWDE